MEPADYSFPPLGIGRNEVLDTAGLTNAELRMSLALVRYVRHLASGRLVPQSVSASLDLKPERPDPLLVLQTLSGTDDPLAGLAAYHPRHPQQ